MYELTPGKPWREKVIHRFCLQFDGTGCLDGEGPSGIVVDLNNTIFGVTSDGGLKKDKYAGTLYQLASTGQKKWTHTVLHYLCEETHCTDGANPVGLASDSAGNLFGTAGGGPNCEPRRPCGGIAYKLIPNGSQSQYSVLYDFCAVEDCADGNYPQAPLTLDGSGNLFGSTLNGGGPDSDLNHRGGGGLFQLGSSYQVTYAFCNQEACADGEYPTQLLLDGKGNAFGITIAGGEYEHGGTVFELAP